MALLFLSLPLASAARVFCRDDGWKEFGYARLSDHARERFDRSARWVRDLAALSEATERLPGIASALTGEDGGRPIGLIAAGHIGKVASPESLAVWLSMARTHSVRELKAWTCRAVAAGSCWPVAEDDPAVNDLPPEGDAHQRVCLFVPAAVREAFAETLDLYRAVEGHTAPVSEFIDSLIAEAASGALAGRLDLAASDDETHGVLQGERALHRTEGHGKSRRTRQDETVIINNRQDRDMKNPAVHLGQTPAGRSTPGKAPGDQLAQDTILRTRARRWLQDVLWDDLPAGDDTASQPSSAAGSPRPAGSSSATNSSAAVEADTRMRRIISLHDQIERQLAEVVTEMADIAAWRVLGYDGLGDYARRGLGWSRATLYGRVRLVRCLRRLPVVGEAYNKGDIGQVAARTIVRLLTPEAHAGTIPLGIPATTQQAWVERAATATIKRLRDETRAVARLMVMGMGEREPLDDRAWHASLHRQAGTAQRRVQTLTRMALAVPGPLLPLRLYLESETAAELSRVLAVTRRDARLVQTFSMREPIRNGGLVIADPGRESVKTPPGVESAGQPGFQTFPADNGTVPVWVALLALLQEFTDTWDVDVSGRRPSAQRIYNRDGWRCMAPGCTSRRNLEVHHIVYRSQGGDDRPGNLACLCRFHHQMGEHGLLARVRGEAPLGLWWRLGRQACGGTFRNELRLTG